MLSQFTQLVQNTDGRYATDSELEFLYHYLQTAPLRFRVYQKLKAAETDIVRRVYEKLRSQDPTLLQQGSTDLSAKWKADTLRVLRFSATALLLDDPQWLQEQLLFWLQTIMRAFRAQRSCAATYAAMQEIIDQVLSPAEAALFRPILALNQSLLGQTSTSLPIH